MKKILLTLSAFALLQITSNAQAPAGFNYQGIARTSSGAPMASKMLGMRITIHDGTATGTPVYQETQTVTTNAYGLYNMTIGGGTAVTGTLGGVNWASGAKFIQVEMDAAGGTAYSDLGTSQLQSVPYAMAAASAPAPALTLTGSTLNVGGNTVTLPTYTAGTGITITGTSVAASNTTALWNANQIQGKSVSATAPTAGQELVWNGTAWTPTTPATAASYTGGAGITVSSGGVISANNLSGDVSGATSATTVAKIQGTAVSSTAPTSGQVLKYNGTAWAGAADADAQTLSISGNSLSVSGGNTITLPSYTAGTGITVSGTNVVSANSLAGDVTGAPNANTVAKIQGVSVAATAPTSGQVLKYNGTAYAPAADAGVTSTSTTNYLPKTTGTGTEGNSAIYDNNSRIGINTTAPQLDLDMVADTFGIRSPGAIWDNLWFHVDGSYASINANGADNGLMLRVGANGGSFSTGITYNSTASTLDTVMTLLPNGNVGVNTMTPKSTMEVVGSFGAAIKYVAASNASSYTAGDEYTIVCAPNASTLQTTVTLPSASNMRGRIYVVRRLPSASPLPGFTQTVVVASSSTLYGNTVLTASGTICVTYQSDGTNWISIGQF